MEVQEGALEWQGCPRGVALEIVRRTVTPYIALQEVTLVETMRVSILGGE
jgi:hypothetical protein